MLDLLYLLGCAAFGLWTLRRASEEPESVLGEAIVTSAGGLFLALLLGFPSIWAIMRLLCWGLFVAGPIWALAGAVSAWPETRQSSVVLALGGLALAAVGVDAVWIEPRALQVTRYTLASDEVTQPLRLVLVADIQTDAPGAYELEAMKRAMAEEPDALLFAGDYIQLYEKEPEERALDALNEIFREAGVDRVPLGAWAVQGNTDHPPQFARAFDGLPVEVTDVTRTYTAGELTVTALSFDDGFDQDLVVPEAEGFHVVLSHGPDFAMGQIGADLLVAGHTHGGQVRVPVVNYAPVTFSRSPKEWASGRTELPSGATLIVSRGIGLERQGAPPIRFACRPEIVVIDVVPEG